MFSLGLIKSSLTAKLSLAAMSAMIITAAGITAIAAFNISNIIQTDAQEKQLTGLDTAAAILNGKLPGFSIRWTADGHIERLVMDEPIPTEFMDHSMIDQVGRATGETVAIFAYEESNRDFWRRSTNIKKDNGTRAVGTSLGLNGRVYPVVSRGETYAGEATILGKDYFAVYEPIFNARGAVVGILYVGIEKSAISSLQSTALNQLFLASGLILLVIGLGAIIGLRRVVKPITTTSVAVNKIADGELNITVPNLDKQDELGQLANAVNILKEKSLEREQLKSDADRAASLQGEHQEKVESLISSFHIEVQDKFNAIAQNAQGLENTAGALTGVAQQTTGDAAAADEASKETTQNVQSVAAALEQLSAAIGEVTHQCVETNEIVDATARAISGASETVGTLEESANRIGDVVRLISDIAEQTNLLALNATIEAARAGEAGKGFAVVASEVKELASQTAKATSEISAQITDIQESTRSAVGAISDVGTSMSRVTETASAIAAAVEEQESTTAEISRSVAEVSSYSQQLDTSIYEVRSSAVSTNDAAGNVSDAVHELRNSTNSLKERVETFLNEVRAA